MTDTQLTLAGGADFDTVLGATPLPLGRDVMPFCEFPAEHRERIAEQVQAPKAPRRWLSIGLASIPSRAWYEWHWHRGINPERKGNRLEAELRAAVIHRDGYVCGICGLDVDPKDVHIDHIYPRSLGGLDRLDNLQVAHSLCNLRKGAKV